LHAQTADDLTSFKAKVDDTTAEAMRTGNVTAPLQRTDSSARSAPNVGPKQYDAYAANLQMGRDRQAVSQLDPEQQRGPESESYAHETGRGIFGSGGSRQDLIHQKAVKASTAESDKDPAGFAITRLSVVGDAYKKFAVRRCPIRRRRRTRAPAAAREYATKGDHGNAAHRRSAG